MERASERTVAHPSAAASQLNPLKLARMHAMSEAVVDELHQGGLDQRSLARLEQTTGQTLVEIGSAVPDALLEELGGLFGPSAERPTEDELRVLWAQMLGWLHGIALSEQLDALRAESPPPTPTSADEDHAQLAPRRLSPYL